MLENSPSSLSALPRRLLGGLPVIAASPELAATAVIHSSQAEPRRGAAVHLINAYSIALAQKDLAFRDSLSRDAHNFPDGKPLSWVTRLTRQRLSQVRGPQFFQDVLDKGRASGVRHFLLGGSDELLVALRRNLEVKYPGLTIAGTHSPPFRPLTAAEVASQDKLILEADADIVWVGLGTPKQDHEVQRLAYSLPVVACAVGAAFDFAAGTKREAPTWMTRVGMEWLFRLLSEPRRLWKRYLIGNFIFVMAVVGNRRR
ncbi:N-acetylglucosaminyldiphosphoundecaprenol N-acetyl-beta-D-mannosaminyltransferase [Curtobacterium sp. PhB137]|uniref:WecB/TagA/CpsF family glycosyltransferase n=1 Tax=Curtobacterium sp. PhB137 TaxID=2485182 RepID=UPI000F4E4497|nr:WecB/TagA/CpsF family glycosyltransferase [Curtobacterium sp. PhB137]RPE85238.1 N-acetylglucosaminyldiphosphoundecaprenol N-acetyl-beta-D-mannosaminyltransferase [Curtobacterium sp. PhB137]